MASDLINILSERALAAGFHPSIDGKLTLTNHDNWPEGKLEDQMAYYFSDFASILVVDITTDNISEAYKKAKRAETFLDAELVEREKTTGVIDGYLVLVFRNMSEELRPFISKIENDTRFVRKHVVFKCIDGWERYQRITPLGLINVGVSTSMVEYVPKSKEAFSLLDAVEQIGGTFLAKEHGKKWNLNE